MISRKRIAYLLYGFHIGGMESFLYRVAHSLRDEFDFTFIATHVPDILPKFHEVGMAVYLGEDYRRIIDYLRQHRIDLVQYANNRLYADAALAAGVPVVIERTDGLRSGAALRPKDGIDAVIASTRGSVEAISKLIDPERITMIYNGIDVSRFDAADADRLGFSPDDILIGRVSRFGEGKNLGLLIDAIRALQPRFTHAKLILVGGNSKMPGAPDEELVLRKRAEGLDNCVVFTGYIDDPTRIIKGFDIGTCVSRQNNEGIPNSLLESMACGQPVVATRVDDIPEIVLDGVNGILIADNALDELVTALTQLIEDRTLRSKMGQAGRALIERQFNIDTQAQEYANLYRSLLEAAKPSRARMMRYQVMLALRLIAARIPDPLVMLFKRVRGKVRATYRGGRTPTIM